MALSARPTWAQGHVHSVPESSDPRRRAWWSPARTAPPPWGGSLRAEPGPRLDPRGVGRPLSVQSAQGCPGPTQAAGLLGVPDFPVLSLTIGPPLPTGCGSRGAGSLSLGPPIASHKAPPTQRATSTLGSARSSPSRLEQPHHFPWGRPPRGAHTGASHLSECP